jgi:WhiB family transcriptional regulator, redox-sensing transcriptional regulator
MTQFIMPAAEAHTAWVSKARCRFTDPDELFVRGAAQRKAALICRHCPVIAECGAEALDNRVEFGVWGGMTERERRALLKRHPEVVSWAEFFAARRQSPQRRRSGVPATAGRSWERAATG